MNKIYTTPEITTIVKELCNSTKNKKDFSWHYLYIISNIRMRHLLDRRYLKEDYVPVNVELLRTIISKQESNSVLKNLIKLGILETDNIIIAGSKSRGFRLTETYQECKWSLTDIKDLKLAEKLSKKQVELKDEVNKHGKGYRIVNYWTSELEINSRNAKRYIKKQQNLTEKEEETYLKSVEMIEKKQFFRYVDSKAKRFHSNLTNISTPLRQFLSIDGQELWGTDLTSSQPVFMAILLKNIPTINKEELERFTNCVVGGQFYEYLAKEANLDLDLNDFKTRKDFKQKIFGGVLFDRNRKNLSKWELVFQKSFPTILDAVREIKKKDYNSFAIMLQKAEAEFFFKAVEESDMIIGRGKAPLLTIHDSIVSSKEYIDIIQQVLENQFQTLHNITPKLKTEKL